MATHIGIFITGAMVGIFLVLVPLEVSEGAEFNPLGIKVVVISISAAVAVVVVQLQEELHPVDLSDGHLLALNGNTDGMRHLAKLKYLQ
jgi:hypothetical protein